MTMYSSEIFTIGMHYDSHSPKNQSPLNRIWSSNNLNDKVLSDTLNRGQGSDSARINQTSCF